MKKFKTPKNISTQKELITLFVSDKLSYERNYYYASSCQVYLNEPCPIPQYEKWNVLKYRTEGAIIAFIPESKQIFIKVFSCIGSFGSGLNTFSLERIIKDSTKIKPYKLKNIPEERYIYLSKESFLNWYVEEFFYLNSHSFYYLEQDRDAYCKDSSLKKLIKPLKFNKPKIPRNITYRLGKDFLKDIQNTPISVNNTLEYKRFFRILKLEGKTIKNICHPYSSSTFFTKEQKKYFAFCNYRIINHCSFDGYFTTSKKKAEENFRKLQNKKDYFHNYKELNKILKKYEKNKRKFNLRKRVNDLILFKKENSRRNLNFNYHDYHKNVHTLRKDKLDINFSNGYDSSYSHFIKLINQMFNVLTLSRKTTINNYNSGKIKKEFIILKDYVYKKDEELIYYNDIGIIVGCSIFALYDVLSFIIDNKIEYKISKKQKDILLSFDVDKIVKSKIHELETI